MGSADIFEGDSMIRMAPPAEFVPGQIAALLEWAGEDSTHVLVKSCAFIMERFQSRLKRGRAEGRNCGILWGERAE